MTVWINEDGSRVNKTTSTPDLDGACQFVFADNKEGVCVDRVDGKWVPWGPWDTVDEAMCALWDEFFCDEPEAMGYELVTVEG